MKHLWLLLAVLPLLATAEPELRTQLRDALYVEEVDRNPAAAAEAYERILADFDSQRPLAASALFRLAEVRRKQARKEEAIAHYQRLLQQFPEFEAEAALARQHLTDLGGKLPATGTSLANEEAAELQRLQQFAQTAPDLLRDPATLSSAVQNGWPEVVKFLLDQGAVVGDSQALSIAAKAGRIDLCRILIEHGGLSDNVRTTALLSAVEGDRAAVLTFLLDNGFDANAPVSDGGSPLIRAVEKGNPDIVSLLLDHGAKIDFAVDGSGTFMETAPFGTALHQAVLGDDLDIFQLLLKRGASPDVPAPKCNLTPLHFAVSSRSEHSLDFTTTLLAKGADPNRRTEPVNEGLPAGSRYSSAYNSITPLQLAIRRADQAKTRALLEAGAKVQQADLRTITQHAASGILELILEHTPRFSADDPAAQALLSTAMEGNPEVVPLLIAHGAAPSQAEISELFPRARHELLPSLIENYLLPKLTKQPKIQLLLDDIRGQRLFALADSTTASPPPSLPRLLLENKIAYTRPSTDEANDRWLLWRQDDAGKLQSIDINLKESDPLPTLAWGDVIERRIVEAKETANFNRTEELPLTLLWDLTRRISIPLTITIGDSTREFTVRGDRLVYDPTKPELPYLSTAKIINLLRPDLNRRPDRGEVIILIQRKGWQETSINLGNIALEHFRLEPGDHLTLKIPALSPEAETEIRQRRITLRIPGTSYEHYFDAPANPAAAPTLTELLAHAFAGETWGFTRQYFESIPLDPELRLGAILQHQNELIFATPVVLPHPDFANIAIHRLAPDGSESVLPVNLSDIIAKCTEDTTREEARSSDIPLLPGDIIALPLVPSDQPWTGFPPDQDRYFQKVLSGTIQITFQDGTIAQHFLNWQPTRWTPSAAGLLPLPPETGTASTRAVNLGFHMARAGESSLLLTRDNADLGDVGLLAILRDGDRVYYPGGTELGAPSRMPLHIRSPENKPSSSGPVRVRRVPTPPRR